MSNRIHVDGGEVVVQVVRHDALPCIVSQHTCHHFGFARRDGTPDGPRYLAFIRNHRVPSTADGKLRLVAAADLVAAIASLARVGTVAADARPAPGASAGAVSADGDDGLLARAGVRRTRRAP